MATPAAIPDLGRPQSESRKWFEPTLVVCMMLGSLIINRRRRRAINNFSSTTTTTTATADDSSPSASLLQKNEPYASDSDDDLPHPRSRSPRSSRSRRRCCAAVHSLDTSRFAAYPHSRLLQKFPFLVEMFYWALNYLTYAMTKNLAAALYSNGDNKVTELAQQHGIDILNLEHHSILSLFFLPEAGVQHFFLRHSDFLSLFNQIYSLVHIPGTVAFLSWYYWAAPNHETFAVARRTMTLGNFAAFFVFSFYPCMPPRLLPESYGFKDTVRQEHAESVWTNSKNVNELAAMPSLHFTYAFVVGCTFLHHSGLPALLRSSRRGTSGSSSSGGEASAPRRSLLHTIAFSLAAFLYPALVLTVIVATANHYWFDAVVATVMVTISFCINRVWLLLLPAEHLLCWVLRINKPIPTTGQATASAAGAQEWEENGEGVAWRVKERQSVDIRYTHSTVGGREV